MEQCSICGKKLSPLEQILQQEECNQCLVEAEKNI